MCSAVAGINVIAFDYWKERSWAVVEHDPLLSFETGILNEAFAVWCAHAESGTIPPRSALTARDMKTFLGSVLIVERQDDGRYRVRLMGTKITQVIGEMQGRIIEEALPPDAVARWRMGFDLVLSELRPMRFVSKVIVQDIRCLQAEILLAPLLDEAGRPNMVFGVAIFKTGENPETVMHEIPDERN